MRRNKFLRPTPIRDSQHNNITVYLRKKCLILVYVCVFGCVNSSPIKRGAISEWSTSLPYNISADRWWFGMVSWCSSPNFHMQMNTVSCWYLKTNLPLNSLTIDLPLIGRTYINLYDSCHKLQTFTIVLQLSGYDFSCLWNFLMVTRNLVTHNASDKIITTLYTKLATIQCN